MAPRETPIIQVAEFAFAAARADQLPAATLPEIAFGGRSNVGKSSLLNALLERKSLVRTSKAPGATRQVNQFRVVTTVPPLELYVVDLPGYGYAVRSKAERTSWGTLIEAYLTTRETLRALVLLIDIRRGIEDDDRQLVEFWEHERPGKPIILVATKLDKLALNKRKPAMVAMQKACGVRVVGFSAVTGDGREDLWRLLASALATSASST